MDYILRAEDADNHETAHLFALLAIAYELKRMNDLTTTYRDAEETRDEIDAYRKDILSQIASR